MQINLKELSTQAIKATTGKKKMCLSENAQSMVLQLFTKTCIPILLVRLSGK